MAKKTKKRAKKYEPKVALKKDVEWDDLINLSLKDTSKNEALKSKSKKKK